MESLDASRLSDEALVSTFGTLWAEVTRRGGQVLSSVQIILKGPVGPSGGMDWPSDLSLFELKERIDQEVGRLIRGDRQFRVRVWQLAGETRVYITDLEAHWRDKEVEYYHTGNPVQPAGTLHLAFDAARAVRWGSSTKAEIWGLCAALAAHWPGLEHVTEVTAEHVPSSWPRKFCVVWTAKDEAYYLDESGQFSREADPVLFDTRAEAEAAIESWCAAHPYERKPDVEDVIG